MNFLKYRSLIFLDNLFFTVSDPEVAMGAICCSGASTAVTNKQSAAIAPRTVPSSKPTSKQKTSAPAANNKR